MKSPTFRQNAGDFFIRISSRVCLFFDYSSGYDAFIAGNPNHVNAASEVAKINHFLVFICLQ